MKKRLPVKPVRLGVFFSYLITVFAFSGVFDSFFEFFLYSLMTFWVLSVFEGRSYARVSTVAESQDVAGLAMVIQGLVMASTFAIVVALVALVDPDSMILPERLSAFSVVGLAVLFPFACLFAGVCWSSGFNEKRRQMRLNKPNRWLYVLQRVTRGKTMTDLPLKSGRFLLVFIGTTLAVAAALLAIEAATGTNIRNAGMSLVPYFTAASVEGQRFARGAQNNPSTAAIWNGSLVMGLLGIAGSFILALPFVMGPLGRSLLAATNPLLLIGLVVMYAALGTLMSRLFWGIGYKSERRAQAKKGQGK